MRQTISQTRSGEVNGKESPNAGVLAHGSNLCGPRDRIYRMENSTTKAFFAHSWSSLSLTPASLATLASHIHATCVIMCISKQLDPPIVKACVAAAVSVFLPLLFLFSWPSFPHFLLLFFLLLLSSFSFFATHLFPLQHKHTQIQEFGPTVGIHHTPPLRSLALPFLPFPSF